MERAACATESRLRSDATAFHGPPDGRFGGSIVKAAVVPQANNSPAVRRKGTLTIRPVIHEVPDADIHVGRARFTLSVQLSFAGCLGFGLFQPRAVDGGAPGRGSRAFADPRLAGPFIGNCLAYLRIIILYQAIATFQLVQPGRGVRVAADQAGIDLVIQTPSSGSCQSR